MISDLITPEQVPEAIESAKTAGEYRPTAVMVALTPSLSVVTVNPVREPSKDVFWLPQGGVDLDRGETPAMAAHRELDEELGLVAEDAHLLGATVHDTPRGGRDGFERGKLLIAYGMPLTTDIPEFHPNPEEVRAYRLSTIGEATARMFFNAGLRKETLGKAVFSTHVMKEAARLISA